MLKKSLSIILALVMVVSVIAVMATATGAVTYDNTKLYFDVSTTGWAMGAKDKVGFYVHSVAEGEEIAWGGKKLNGTDEGNGIWSYDPAAKGMTINDGVQYQVIFTGAGQQTADLFFDTTCYGHVAYCNGEMIENTVDSSKKNQVALWKDLDPADYGPVKGITSLGNLVGTCLPQGETDESLFTAWLTDTGSTGLKNAMKYTVEPGVKTAQKLVDDLAGALNLTKDFVKSAIEENQAGINAALALDESLTKPFDWSYDASTLPAAAAPTEPETAAPTEPETAAPTEPETQPAGPVRGDADKDKELTITDATLIQRFLAELVGEDALDMEAADADKDGEVSIIDATLIQRVLLHICDWDKKPIENA